MSALLTYRSRNSFESRFGRTIQEAKPKGEDITDQTQDTSRRPVSPSETHWAIHNHGHRNAKSARTPGISASDDKNPYEFMDPQFSGTTKHSADCPTQPQPAKRTPSSTTTAASHPYFSAQSYLRHQASKFTRRFDSNCYISLTRKLDTHDVSRGRISGTRLATVASALSTITQPVLVLGIESDGLFAFAEQEELVAGIGGNARLEKIESLEGHDAFLLQFEQVNGFVLGFLREAVPDVVAREPDEGVVGGLLAEDSKGAKGKAKASMTGEAEGDEEDFTAW